VVLKEAHCLYPATPTFIFSPILIFTVPIYPIVIYFIDSLSQLHCNFGVAPETSREPSHLPTSHVTSNFPTSPILRTPLFTLVIMATSFITPTYIYKILPSNPPPPSPLPLALPVSALDRRDNFIHLSTSRQLIGTLQNFFADGDYVWILRIPYARVEKWIKWENSVGKGPDEPVRRIFLSVCRFASYIVSNGWLGDLYIKPNRDVGWMLGHYWLDGIFPAHPR
jgi:uncharacterized protein (DUF952 family)